MAEKLKITRKKLYEEIWDEAPTRIAAKYTISYQKLKSVCEQLNIPMPSQQYHRDKRSGAEVTVPPLPDSDVTTVEIDVIEHR